MGTKVLLGGFAALLIAAGGYSVASPYFAIGEIRDAMRDGKADVLRQHIDFPALRESVKGQLNAAMMKSAAKDRGENLHRSPEVTHFRSCEVAQPEIGIRVLAADV